MISFLSLLSLCDTAAVYGPCASSFGMRPIHPYLNDALSFLCGNKTEFTNYEKWERESKSSEATPLATLNATEPFSLKTYYQDELLVSPGTTSAPSLSFSGRLLGGCLDILTILCGTRYDKVGSFIEKYSNDGIIWFLEACDLNSLSVLRSLWQLKNAGWFEKTKGFLIGRPLRYNENFMGIDCLDAVIRILKEYKVPIILDVDLGHLPPQMPFVSGATANITVKGNSLKINYSLRDI